MAKGNADGCAACAKWLLIIFNILFCILGIGLIAAGAYVYVELRDYFDFIGNDKVSAPAIILIVFGVITFLIAALGCIGACKESACMLFTFAAIIGVLLLAEIIVGIVAFVYKDKVNDWVEENGPKLLEQAKNNESEGVVNAWNVIQKELHCCGFTNYEDWDGKIPDSCYENPDKKDTRWKDGCKDELIKFAKKNIVVVGGVAIGFGVIELLGIVFACCVGCAARKGEYA